MKRVLVPIDGLEHWPRGRTGQVSSFLAESLNRLARHVRRHTWAGLALAFALGFLAAVWTVGLITSAR